MNWRSRRVLVPLLIVCIVLIIGIAVVYLRGSASANPTIFWQASTQSFTQQEQQAIQTAFRSSFVAANPTGIAENAFTIIDAQRQGDWADFSLNERVSQNTQSIATEPLFFLAHLQAGTWMVWLPSSPGFCDQLKQTPDTLLDPIDKQYFRGCSH
jgi:hypothetical protein